MEKPNCFSWNTIIRTFAKDSVNDHSHDALFFFSQMVADGFVGPNKFTFLFVLKACAKMGNLEYEVQNQKKQSVCRHHAEQGSAFKFH
ncbi:hypothetical protein DVH24_028656 [Malus domestica]|uniref:Pentatricopeptide repeat-containing protein n=1 Tax=Malus domestica TaxID=3750 RepID=A0A498IV79_MALDO|nr:hypothetical protein DVH24_028656 [Malus domestica]